MFETLWAVAQIIGIDVIMAGDNAVVVGMAAAAVPREMRRRTIVLGTAAAVVLRILLALVAVELLHIVGLTLAGGFLLGYVAYAMYQDLRGRAGEARGADGVRAPHSSVRRAVAAIVMADLSMSLDNVLAVAGAANGHLQVLVFGLMVSVVLMAVAASAIAKVIERHAWVAWIGLSLVAYVAVTMIVRGGGEVFGAVLPVFAG